MKFLSTKLTTNKQILFLEHERTPSLLTFLGFFSELEVLEPLLTRMQNIEK
jgi:hypothetical protein